MSELFMVIKFSFHSSQFKQKKKGRKKEKNFNQYLKTSNMKLFNFFLFLIKSVY